MAGEVAVRWFTKIELSRRVPLQDLPLTGYDVGRGSPFRLWQDGSGVSLGGRGRHNRQKQKVVEFWTKGGLTMACSLGTWSSNCLQLLRLGGGGSGRVRQV
jgi:hypothetical protein